MNIYAYAIIDSNIEINGFINGLEESRVYNIPFRDVGVIVSELENRISDVTKDHVLRHEEVVEKLMENFTVLPVRFCTLFNRKEDLISMMDDYYDDFQADLYRLRNKVEFGIKVIWPGAIIRKRIEDAYRKALNDLLPPNGSLAKNFMKEKFEKYKIDGEFEEEADRCIAVIDDFFKRLISERKFEKLKTGNLLLNASYLVDRDRQNDFKKAFEELRASPGDLRYLFTGPWPPYNFVTPLPSLGKKSLGKKSRRPDMLNRIVQNKG